MSPFGASPNRWTIPSPSDLRRASFGVGAEKESEVVTKPSFALSQLRVELAIATRRARLEVEMSEVCGHPGAMAEPESLGKVWGAGFCLSMKVAQGIGATPSRMFITRFRGRYDEVLFPEESVNWTKKGRGS